MPVVITTEIAGWFSKGFGWLLSSVTGSLITYGCTRWRDKNNEEKKMRQSLRSVCNSVSFTLALQQSELSTIKKA